MRHDINEATLKRAIQRFTDVVETQIAEAVEFLVGEELTARLSEIAETLTAQRDKIQRVWLPVITDEIGRTEKRKKKPYAREDDYRKLKPGAR